MLATLRALAARPPAMAAHLLARRAQPHVTARLLRAAAASSSSLPAAAAPAAPTTAGGVGVPPAMAGPAALQAWVVNMADPARPLKVG